MSLLAAALLSCIPALPFYCRNIHIGCAGRSTIRTQNIEINDATVTFSDGTLWEISRKQDRDALILRRNEHRDWLRVEADGRFSLRRYDNTTPLMTRGTCTARK